MKLPLAAYPEEGLWIPRVRPPGRARFYQRFFSDPAGECSSRKRDRACQSPDCSYLPGYGPPGGNRGTNFL